VALLVVGTGFPTPAVSAACCAPAEEAPGSRVALVEEACGGCCCADAGEGNDAREVEPAREADPFGSPEGPACPDGCDCLRCCCGATPPVVTRSGTCSTLVGLARAGLLHPVVDLVSPGDAQFDLLRPPQL